MSESDEYEYRIVFSYGQSKIYRRKVVPLPDWEQVPDDDGQKMQEICNLAGIVRDSEGWTFHT